MARARTNGDIMVVVEGKVRNIKRTIGDSEIFKCRIILKHIPILKNELIQGCVIELVLQSINPTITNRGAQ